MATYQITLPGPENLFKETSYLLHLWQRDRSDHVLGCFRWRRQRR